MNVTENVSLSTLSTFKTGGLARYVATINTKDELVAVVAFAKEKNLPLIPWGSGSNMLPPDSGLDAVVVRYLPNSISSTEEGKVTVEAGAIWDSVVSYAVDRGWWGIENLSAIPGTMGAAVVQNIGAYGAALETALTSVEAFDTTKNLFKTFSSDECDFGYRTSIFKKEPDRYIITDSTLQLSTEGEPNLSYADLQKYFNNVDGTPSLASVRNAVREIRAGKFPDLTVFGTAGSFFLNPIFSPEAVTEIRSKFPEMPVYELPEGGIKVPLAYIFDQIMHAKGRRVGGAVIWDKQPLVIVTERGATSHDVVLLAKSIVDDFFSVAKIKIIPEVRLFSNDKNFFTDAIIF